MATFSASDDPAVVEARALVESAAGSSPGLPLDDATPRAARWAAAAFGLYLRRSCPRPARADQVGHCDGQPPPTGAPPRVVLAGDGRSETAARLAAAAWGLRWAACEVLLVGAATLPAMRCLVGQLNVDGGMLLGAPGWSPSRLVARYWSRGGEPLAETSLAQVAACLPPHADRPARRFGALGRADGTGPYLARFAPYGHALRPLAFLLDSRSPAFGHDVRQWLEPTACRAVEQPIALARLAGDLSAGSLEFALRVDGLATKAEVFDERGRPVAPAAIASLVVVPARPRLEGAGPIAPPRAELSELRESIPHDPMAALVALLVVLSRDDRPLSAWLPEPAAAGSADPAP